MPAGRTATVVLVLWAGLAVAAEPATGAGELEAGRQAIFAADYAKALQILSPLAEQGDEGRVPRQNPHQPVVRRRGDGRSIAVEDGLFRRDDRDAHHTPLELLGPVDGFLDPADHEPSSVDA